jgi:hypothetical protein
MKWYPVTKGNYDRGVLNRYDVENRMMSFFYLQKMKEDSLKDYLENVEIKSERPIVTRARKPRWFVWRYPDRRPPDPCTLKELHAYVRFLPKRRKKRGVEMKPRSFQFETVHYKKGQRGILGYLR